MVASSLVCLPPEDAGGAGPKVESWAFGTDREGLDVLARNRVFGVRTCKLCDDGVVVRLCDDTRCLWPACMWTRCVSVVSVRPQWHGVMAALSVRPTAKEQR